MRFLKGNIAPYFSGIREEFEGKISVKTGYKPVDSGVDAVRLGGHSLSRLCDCHTPIEDRARQISGNVCTSQSLFSVFISQLGKIKEKHSSGDSV